MKCKHDNGWSLVKNAYLFVHPNGRIHCNFKRETKLLFRCNYTNCNKVRNIYLNPKVLKYGKIRSAKLGEIER